MPSVRNERGPRAGEATFWLLEAPDSLAQQSRREPDGAGHRLRSTPTGGPVVSKQPLAAYEDQEFAREARGDQLADVRRPRPLRVQRRPHAAEHHPFEQHGRLFAHNGVIGDLGALEAELGDAMALVAGETDSERFFALITREIDRAGGDVGAGIAARPAGWPRTCPCSRSTAC